MLLLVQENKQRKINFISGIDRLFGLVECESQQFLSFLRLLYSFYFSDRTDDEMREKRKVFKSATVYSSASFFLYLHPSFLPSFLHPPLVLWSSLVQ